MDKMEEFRNDFCKTLARIIMIEEFEKNRGNKNDYK